MSKRQAFAASSLILHPSSLVLLCGALCASTAAAAAQKYPSRPVRMVIAATVGAGPDIVARAMGIKLTEAWGEQIVVDNRPGASGLIGAETVVKAAPDGYTLWLSTLTQLISTTLYRRLNVAREFAPVGLVATTPFILTSSAALPVKSMAELIEYARARPGQLLYGSGGEGSTGHLCMEILAKAAGVTFTHVPY